MVQLREEFFNIDSEHYIIYLSSSRGAELPPIPNFYDISGVQEEDSKSIPEEFQGVIDCQNVSDDGLKGISITKHAICLYVACDEVDFPLRLELWDTPPNDIGSRDLEAWFYVAEVSFDLSCGELYIHGLMDHDVAQPIYIAPDTYRIRFYLGSLNTLDEDYIHTHWSITEDGYEEGYWEEGDFEDAGSRLHDPERSVWCRLALWPSPYSPPRDILVPILRNYDLS